MLRQSVDYLLVDLALSVRCGDSRATNVEIYLHNRWPRVGKRRREPSAKHISFGKSLCYSKQLMSGVITPSSPKQAQVKLCLFTKLCWKLRGLDSLGCLSMCTGRSTVLNTDLPRGQLGQFNRLNWFWRQGNSPCLQNQFWIKTVVQGRHGLN